MDKIQMQEEFRPRLESLTIAMNRLVAGESPWSGSFDTNDIKLEGNKGKIYRVPNMVFFEKSNATEVIKWLKDAAGI